MYLKRITLAGFKSFASKTVIELEPGITAIVGPNGSGKSNVADAIRWAMGEQSRSRLRLGDRNEVVFAGSDGRARASMAEVSLVFDNTSGQLPIEASEVEFARKLYRSGETEYFLMGRPTRLSEIQLLLAQGRVGAGTYAVVGQGMIDSLIMGSPAERKELFDEAAGIRADELKRESSLRQLARTQVNVTRLRDIETELADRLKSLERVAASGRRLEADKAEVEDLKQRLVTTFWHELNREADAIKTTADELKTVARQVDQTDKELSVRSARHAKASQDAAALKTKLQTELSNLEQTLAQALAERMQFETQQARRDELEGELKAARDVLKGLSTQLTKTGQKRRAMVRELDDLKAAVARSEGEMKKLSKPVEAAQAALLALRRDQEDGNQRQYIDHALSTLKLVAQNLTDDEPPLEQLRLLVHKTGRLLSHAARTAGPDLVAELEAARTKLEQAMSGRESVSEHITNLTLSQRSYELELTHHDEMLEARQLEYGRHQVTVGKLEQGLLQAKAATQLLKAATMAVQKQREQLASLRERLAELDRSEGGSDEKVAIALDRERNVRAREEIGQSEKMLRERTSTHDARTQVYKALIKRYELQPGVSTAPRDSTSELERKLELVESRLRIERETFDAGAAEELEIRSRRDELSTQIADLEQAEVDLRTVIERLDGAIAANFEDGFGRIAERFGHYFGELFEGGKATLELEIGEDNRYGIDIKASAKGKRLSSLSAMSGGERALTGVALLAAIVDAGSNPFIVLDEVDAALDESNSGKFAAILETLAARTQLIVVTHNRQTMTAAPTLYGVTLGKGHVSSLLSLRLEQAQSLAAR